MKMRNWETLTRAAVQARSVEGAIQALFGAGTRFSTIIFLCEVRDERLRDLDLFYHPPCNCC